MTGKPQTRYELVEGLGTSVTTVNRVVAQLEKAGAIITREIGSDGRQALFLRQGRISYCWFPHVITLGTEDLKFNWVTHARLTR